MTVGKEKRASVKPTANLKSNLCDLSELGHCRGHHHIVTTETRYDYGRPIVKPLYVRFGYKAI